MIKEYSENGNVYAMTNFDRNYRTIAHAAVRWDGWSVVIGKNRVAGLDRSSALEMLENAR